MPIVWIEHVLHRVDIVLVMTVNQGFGGQAFLPEMLPKIAALRSICNQRGLNPHIQVDGGLDPDTVSGCVAAGADVIVAGSAIFWRRRLLRSDCANKGLCPITAQLVLPGYSTHPGE